MIGHGEVKFPEAGLLETSVSRQWSSVAAELRSHPACDIPSILPEQMEVTLAVRGSSDAVVHRTGNGLKQATRAHSGTLWLCPIGVKEEAVRITEPLDEVLHIYLPRSRFTDVSRGLSGLAVTPETIDYRADIDDELIRQIALAISVELRAETAGGALLVDSLITSLTTRLALSYSHTPSKLSASEEGSLDPIRLRRVIDYIQANLTSTLTVEELADVACLSRFHFSRAFRNATGLAPHQYVSRHRFDLATKLLAEGHTSILDIALTCGFSSHASFHKAFQRMTGVSPGGYRKMTKN